jgi:hypothetical protein
MSQSVWDRVQLRILVDGNVVAAPQPFDYETRIRQIGRKAQAVDIDVANAKTLRFETELLPAEAGRLGENRCYGLKSFAHDLVIRKLSPPSSGSVPSCWRMYSWMTSSVTLPLDATK